MRRTLLRLLNAARLLSAAQLLSAAMLLSTALVALTIPASGAALPRWSWPIAAPHTVVRAFIAPASPYASGHRGIDIAARNVTVYAPAGGTVHFAGTVVDRPVLSIRHPGGLLSSYEPVTTTLRAGDSVGAGDEIGSVVGGHCASACLHFGVRLNGEYISPLSLLGEVPRAVLLPTRGSS